jgi:hypothetical protein
MAAGIDPAVIGIPIRRVLDPDLLGRSVDGDLVEIVPVSDLLAENVVAEIVDQAVGWVSWVIRPIAS